MENKETKDNYMNEQIQKHMVMDLLLRACPSYCEKWEEYKRYSRYQSDQDEEGDSLYIDLGDFASHLVGLYKGNQLGEFPKVFDVIEFLHINGDADVRNAATIGLLESMQNISLGRDLELDVFTKFLKPESLKWWNKLIDLWEKGTLLSED